MTTESIHKAADVWRHLRPPLSRWAKAAGVPRVRSSPPAFARPLERGYLTVFAIASRGGVDRYVGGQFTLAVQVGDASLPGVDWSAGVDIRTTRMPRLLSLGEHAEALSIHNRVVAKRSPLPSDHFLRGIHDPDRLAATFYQPLADLDDDYWMAFVDADDVEAWADFLGTHLDRWCAASITATHGKYGPPPIGR